MATTKKSRKPERENASKAIHFDTQVGVVVKDVILNLQASRLEKAADLFLKAQEKGVLPANRNIVKRLLDVLGEKTANRLITAFAFHPCQFCTKGRIRCEICEGSGHIEQRAVCERCFGFGVARCSFCNGSGWLALSDIPEGIRAPALVRRAEKTLKDAKSVLNVPIPQLSEDKPISTLKKCAALWVAMDRIMGVVENIVVTYQSSMVPSSGYDQQLRDIIQLAVRAVAKLKQNIRKVVTVMQQSARMEAQVAPPGSARAKLAKNRAEFYRSLLDKADLVYNLTDAHPLLENAIKQRLAGKSYNKNRKSQL
jgi:hypothetical protein